MSSRTASIGEQNCHNLLPYVCERGELIIYLVEVEIKLIMAF